MKKYLLLLPIVLLTLAGCGNGEEKDSESSTTPESSESASESSSESTSESQSESESEKYDLYYDLEFESKILNEKGAVEKFNVNYSFGYLEEDLTTSGLTYKPQLSLLSFASTVSQEKKELAQAFYTTLGFDNQVYSPEYDTDWDKDTVLYSFAHKTIGEKDVIAVSVNGFEYKQAWASNFIWGKEGNAQGFESAATKLRTAFDTYFESYKDNSPMLWVTGYSRSAAICDIFLENLLDEELLPEENVNAYLFEAPGVMVEENIHEHPAIRNVINSGDLIVNALPTAFGFKRSGMDVDIYSTDADKIVSDFYKEKLKLSPFTPKTDYKTEQELADYLLNTILLKKVEIDPEDENPLATHDASTRENYVDNYEKELAYAIGLFFSLKDETINALKAKLEELGFGVIGLLQEDELYNTLKPILDEHEEVYDDEQLHSACNRVAEFGRFQLTTIATFYMDEGAKNDIVRLMEFHSPETVLPLLINYNASLKG